MHMATTMRPRPVTPLRVPCDSPTGWVAGVRDHSLVGTLSPAVDAAIDIDAPPTDVYAVISDVTRTGEWSPECVRCRWISGATHAVDGARYRGWSRNGWRRWSTTSTIRSARPGSELVWDVTYLGRPVARWRYVLDELDGGRTRLTEAVEDRRERWLQIVSPWVTGARDRAARNAATMDTTLHRIKAIVEGDTNRP